MRLEFEADAPGWIDLRTGDWGYEGDEFMIRETLDLATAWTDVHTEGEEFSLDEGPGSVFEPMSMDRREEIVRETVETMGGTVTDVSKHEIAKDDSKLRELDDILFNTYREQIWSEKFEKQMWASSDDVPEFVKGWIGDVVDMVDPLWDQGFEDIPKSAALTVHKEITDSLIQPQGWSVNSIISRIVDEFEWLDEDHARTIVRQEVAGVLNKAREVAYRARSDKVMVDWVGPDDASTTTICRTIKSKIDEQGGSVPLPMLRKILDEVARDYRERGGTPERVDEYVPHYQCRHTMVERE